MDQGQDRVINLWNQFMIWSTKTTEVAIIILVSCLTCIVASSVFFRYVIGYSIFFASELARYLLVWIVFLASSLAIRNGSHIGVEFFKRIVPQKIRTIMIFMSFSLMFFFLLTIGVVSTFYLIPPLWTQVTAAMGVRLFWIFLCIPIGAVLMLLQLVDSMVSNMKYFREEK